MASPVSSKSSSSKLPSSSRLEPSSLPNNESHKGIFFRKKSADMLRTFPVLFVVVLVIFLYTIFVAFHCIPLMQLGLVAEERVQGMYTRGLVEAVVFHFLFVMFVICFIMVIITPAGSIPSSKEWEGPQGSRPDLDDPSTGSKTFIETKRLGARRYCKWCDRYKPDRTHHCRQCRACVLKMDHHCPWIYNCVGWRNHKFFLLTLFYSSALTLMISICQVESVKNAIEESQILFGILFLLLFAESLACFLCLVCMGFFGFHMWMVSHNLSTIEFCEKHFRRHPTKNIYTKGCITNMKEALGYNYLLWLVPVDNRKGDGMHFDVHPEFLHLVGEGMEKDAAEGAQPLLGEEGGDKGVNGEGRSRL